jgi:rod shape-determining protein MreD
MRWFAYLILAYVVLGLQAGLSGYVHVRGAAPNLVLLAVLFITLCAPRDAALLGALGLGLMQDLLTQQPLGLYAFAYGLIAMLVVPSQSMVYAEHPATHVMSALVGSVICSILILLNGWLRPSAGRVAPMTLLYQTLYTALLAPLFIGALMQVRKLFAFQPPRRRI